MTSSKESTLITLLARFVRQRYSLSIGISTDTLRARINNNVTDLVELIAKIFFVKHDEHEETIIRILNENFHAS